MAMTHNLLRKRTMQTLKKILPVAILAAFAGAAQAQVTVYGLIDMSYGKNELLGTPETKFDLHSGGDDGSSQGNSTSRFGIKGSTDVGSGIKANFKLESAGITSNGEVGTPDGTGTNKSPLFNRQAWMGFSGGFGEVRLGRQDDVAFQTMADFDFNGASNGQSAIAAAGIGPWLSDGRQSRSIQYLSPSMSGAKVQVGFVPKGDVVGAKDHFSAGLTFATGDLAVAAAVETKRTETDETFASVSASYDLKVVKLGAGFTDAGGNKNTGMNIGAVAPVAGFNVGVQYARHNDTKVNAVEAFVNKEVLKNTFAYVEAVKKKGGLQSSAVGVIYVF